MIVLTAVSGCVLDFEQFPTDPSVTPQNDVGSSDQGGDSASTDAGGDADNDASPDAGPTIVELGSACVDDTGCGLDKVCRSGFCTVLCDATTPCAEGVCAASEGAFVCAASCDAQCAVNSTLGCVSGSGPTGRITACLPDSDGDGAADDVDNCPDAANPYQQDRDADGLGDICDTEPRCVAGSTDGILDVAPVAFDATGFSVASWSDSPRIPIVGGLKADGTPNTATMILDLRSGTFEPGPEFTASRGIEQAISATPQGFIATTGATVEGGRQNGRFVVLGDDQQFGGSYDRSLYDPIAVTFADASLAIAARINPGDSIWRLMSYDPVNQVLFDLTAFSLTPDRDFYLGRDRNQRGFAYTDGRNLAQSVAVFQFSKGLNTQRNVNMPQGITDPFKPFLTPGAGDSFYVWERTTGDAFLADLETNTVYPRPTMNLTLEGTELHWVSLADGPGFVLIGKNANGELFARVHSLTCWSAANTEDLDLDLVPDVSDTCPFTANDAQTDTDNDGVGDACSFDADGDSVFDDNDFIVDGNGNTVDLRYDTDNDGEDNAVDTDDDGDGIPDATDRYAHDYDNDSYANKYDNDDDNDGFADSIENVLSGQSINPLSFQNSGRMIWVEGTGASRKVQATDLGSGQNDPIDLSADLHYPRWFGRDAIFGLDGEPGVTTKWVRYDVPNGVLASYDFGGPLGGVDPISDGFVTSVAASLFRDGYWSLVVGQVSPDFLVTDQEVGLEVDGVPDANNGLIVFAAGPIGCSLCDLAYYVSGSSVVPLWVDKSEVSLVRYDSSFLLIAKGTKTESAVWTQSGAAGELVPPGIVKVSSAVAMQPTRHILVSGATADGTWQIWLYNTVVRDWFLVTSSSSELGELDWTL